MGPISAKSKNYYLTVFRQSCKWMVPDRRSAELPVEHLKRQKTDDDEHRRALSFDEVCRLLPAAEKAPTRSGMDGQTRAVLYLLTIETGLRVRERQSLTVSLFDFNRCTVTVEGEFCKNRKKAVQLLRHRQAAQLRDFFAGKMLSVKAFNMPSHYRTAKMLRAAMRSSVNGYDRIFFRVLFFTA